MRLVIDNFAKIEKADIQLNGITVIAGLNDTGKSTVGKVLYSMFNSLNSIDKEVTDKRIKDISEICDEIVSAIIDGREFFIFNENNEVVPLEQSLAQKIIGHEGEMTKDIYRSLLKEELGKTSEEVDEEEINEYVENSYAKIAAIKNSSDKSLYKEVLERFFVKVFSQQMNNCDSQNLDAKIKLIIKTKEISVLFNNNHCKELIAPIKILHESFLLDDPFILDDVGVRRFRFGGYGIRENLIRKIVFSERNLMDGIFDAVTSKESLKTIYNVLDKVADGKIVSTRDGMKYSSESNKEPIAIPNLSAGLKGFILIRTLLEKGILKEKDVLILDEPEVHMHTQWQLKYAEIIVLLQKFFDLTILVTTHSSHFLQAIEYYSKYYDINDKCNYYLSRKINDRVVFEDVTQNTNEIHSEMVQPSIWLDRWEEELEYTNEE